jgi:hypothetical protein
MIHNINLTPKKMKESLSTKNKINSENNLKRIIKILFSNKNKINKIQA